jgi:hypothetical protein
MQGTRRPQARALSLPPPSLPPPPGQMRGAPQACNGVGTKRRVVDTNVDIPAGVEHGMVFQLESGTTIRVNVRAVVKQQLRALPPLPCCRRMISSWPCPQVDKSNVFQREGMDVISRVDIRCASRETLPCACSLSWPCSPGVGGLAEQPGPSHPWRRHYHSRPARSNSHSGT